MNNTGNRSFSHFLRYWLPVLLYCLIIFIQSSYPSSKHVPHVEYMDKLLHLGAYAVLSILFFRAFSVMKSSLNIGTLILLSIVFSTLYGISDEFHQHFVPAREADLLDILADFIGSIIGALAGAVIFGYKLQIGSVGRR